MPVFNSPLIYKSQVNYFLKFLAEDVVVRVLLVKREQKLSSEAVSFEFFSFLVGKKFFLIILANM